MINGHNGAHHPVSDGNTITVPALDDQPLRIHRTDACCKRLGDGRGWCARDEGHDGDCDGVRSDRPPPSEALKSRSRPSTSPPPAPPPDPSLAMVVAAVASAQAQLTAAQAQLEFAMKLLGERR